MISNDYHIMSQPKPEGTKSLLLRQMPLDLHGYLLTKQAELKIKCNCQMSIEGTMYSLIRKFKKLEQEGKTDLLGDSSNT